MCIEGGSDDAEGSSDNAEGSNDDVEGLTAVQFYTRVDIQEQLMREYIVAKETVSQ